MAISGNQWQGMATNSKVKKIEDKRVSDCGFLHKTLMWIKKIILAFDI